MLERQYGARFERVQPRYMRDLEWERDEFALIDRFMNAIRGLTSRIINLFT